MDECDFENGVEGCFWENLKLRSYSCYALCKQVRSAIAVAVQMQDLARPFMGKLPMVGALLVFA